MGISGKKGRVKSPDQENAEANSGISDVSTAAPKQPKYIKPLGQSGTEPVWGGNPPRESRT